MEAIIKDLVETTRARDRKGKVIVSFKGTLFTIITRLILFVLISIFVMGFVTLIYNLVTQGISESVQFGIYN